MAGAITNLLQRRVAPDDPFDLRCSVNGTPTTPLRIWLKFVDCFESSGVLPMKLATHISSSDPNPPRSNRASFSLSRIVVVPPERYIVVSARVIFPLGFFVSEVILESLDCSVWH